MVFRISFHAQREVPQIISAQNSWFLQRPRMVDGYFLDCRASKMVHVDVPICHNRVIKGYTGTTLRQADNVFDLPPIKLIFKLVVNILSFDMLHFKSCFPPFA